MQHTNEKRYFEKMQLSVVELNGNNCINPYLNFLTGFLSLSRRYAAIVKFVIKYCFEFLLNIRYYCSGEIKKFFNLLDNPAIWTFSKPEIN